MHPRRVFRDAVAARLAAVFPGAPIHRMRWLPNEDDKLPCLLIYTIREEAVKAGLAHGHPAFENRLTLAVEAIISARASERPEDQLDALCEGVEDALLCDQAWWLACKLESIEAVDTEISGSDAGAANRRLLGARMSFRLTYRTEFHPAGVTPLKAVSVTVLPLEPRDDSADFPPADWRERAQIKVDTDPTDDDEPEDESEV